MNRSSRNACFGLFMLSIVFLCSLKSSNLKTGFGFEDKVPAFFMAGSAN